MGSNMLLWYPENNFTELTSSETNATSEAIPCNFTPSSTRYTPQDGASGEQPGSSNSNTPSFCVEDGLSNADAMLIDGETSNGYQVWFPLDLNGPAVASHQTNSGPGQASWNLPGKP